jgi:hypothetical protein
MSGDYESHWVTDDAFPRTSHNPGPDEKSRLRVRWGKVTEKGSKQSLVIRGMLLIKSSDGQTERGVNWAQGVRVVIARTPSTKPSWNPRYDPETVALADTVTRDNGTFEVLIATYKIRRIPGKTVPFQVAISLGTKSKKTITWTTDDPVLAKTVGTVRVQGPKPLGRTMRLINATLTVQPFEGCNPVSLVRAVNHLRSLGKAKAIARLREYLDIAGMSPLERWDPANIDTSNRECVFLIVRLLFEPANSREKLPDIQIGGLSSPAPRAMQLPDNPLFPLVLRDDVPFLLPVGINHLGPPPDPADHVDWAEKHGKLRAKPLRPPDNPLTAADGLHAFQDTQELRQQAWRMIEHLAGPWKETAGSAHTVWKKHKQKAAMLKIRWAEKKQEYVVAKQ